MTGRSPPCSSLRRGAVAGLSLLLLLLLLASAVAAGGVAGEPSCDLVTAQPEVFGRVQRGGNLPESLWFPSTKNDVIQRFSKFMHENASAVSSPGGPPLPPRSVCNHLVQISDTYRVIFLKNTKTAGTSVLQAFAGTSFLMGALGQSMNCHTCLRSVRANEKMLNLKYRDYFVFTVTRNPFDRAVSSYEYLLSMRRKHWIPGDTARGARCKAPSFREFCDRPYAVALQDQQKSCYSHKEKTRANAPWLGALHDYIHVEPMSQCLLTGSGAPAFDYAIRMDHLAEDFEDLRLNHLNTPERRERGIPTLPKLHMPWTRRPSAGPVSMSRHMEPYRRCGKGCVSAIAKYYKADFDLFKYPSNEAECRAQMQKRRSAGGDL